MVQWSKSWPVQQHKNCKNTKIRAACRWKPNSAGVLPPSLGCGPASPASSPRKCQEKQRFRNVVNGLPSQVAPHARVPWPTDSIPYIASALSAIKMARLEAKQVQLRTCALQCTDSVRTRMYVLAVETLLFVIRRFFMPFLSFLGFHWKLQLLEHWTGKVCLTSLAVKANSSMHFQNFVRVSNKISSNKITNLYWKVGTVIFHVPLFLCTVTLAHIEITLQTKRRCSRKHYKQTRCKSNVFADHTLITSLHSTSLHFTFLYFTLYFTLLHFPLLYFTLLTPQSRVLLEKLTGFHLVKKFPTL